MKSSQRLCQSMKFSIVRRKEVKSMSEKEKEIILQTSEVFVGVLADSIKKMLE